MSQKSRERRAAHRPEPAAADGMSRMTGVDALREADKRLAGTAMLSTNSERLRISGGADELYEDHGRRRERALERADRKRRVYIWCVIAVSVILSAFLLTKMYMNISEQLVLGLQVSEVDISKVSDGVYTDSYESSHLSATVDVTIVSGRIADVELTAFTGIDNARAEFVCDRVVFYQLLNVPDDDVGTQPTDKIVLKAIENALVSSNAYREDA